MIIHVSSMGDFECRLLACLGGKDPGTTSDSLLQLFFNHNSSEDIEYLPRTGPVPLALASCSYTLQAKSDCYFPSGESKALLWFCTPVCVLLRSILL